jgi:arsenite-transporting ATPase
MRVLLHTGKGGVGKTSLAVATALGAAAHGHRAFVLSTDSAHSLGDALGRPVGPEPVEVAPGVQAQEVSALAELDRAWSEIQEWLSGLFQGDGHEVATEELLVFPGLEELVALRAVRDVEQSGEVDVCVVDCAPTGSTLRMLRLPDVLRMFMTDVFQMKRRASRLVKPLADRVGVGRLVAPDEVFAAFERLYGDVEDVRQILLDSDRTSARLVVNPARMVVDETRRSFAGHRRGAGQPRDARRGGGWLVPGLGAA